jgi:hypothetical protein
MMAGGCAYLFTWKLSRFQDKLLFITGLAIIAVSGILLTESIVWPGYLAVLPVLGTCLILFSGQHSLSWLLSNPVMQSIGSASYSIYLWHWPVVVVFYKLEKTDIVSLFMALILAFILGYLSYFLIERRCWTQRLSRIKSDAGILVFSALIVSLSSWVFYTAGIADRPVAEWMNGAQSSPMRKYCHSNNQLNDKRCEYFGTSVEWAAFGDSHVVELAFSLAKELEQNDIGLAHYSFSNCPPLFGIKSQKRAACSIWTDKNINHLNNTVGIRNVVIAYRYSAHFFGGNEHDYPTLPDHPPPISGDDNAIEKRERLWQAFVQMVERVAANKDLVFIVMPVPELGRNVRSKVLAATLLGNRTDNVRGVSLEYYLARNQFIRTKMSNYKFPHNVTVVDPKPEFCDENICYAVRDGVPLYFDGDHMSLAGAKLVVDKILAKN